jgi:predicted PurR-regulated permease PerM
MSTEGPTQGSPTGTPLRQVLLDFWTGRRLLVAAVVVCVVAYAVFRGAPAVAFVLARLKAVCVTLILAIILAYVVSPLVDAFGSLRPFAGSRLGRAAAALCVFLLLLVGFGCLLVLTADPIIQETGRLYGLAETSVQDAPAQLRRLLDSYAAAVPPEVEKILTARAQAIADQALGFAGEFAFGAVVRGWYLVEALLVPVLAFYFVTDADQLREGFLRVLPRSYRSYVLGMLQDMNRMLQGYVRGQLILCLIAAIATSTLLYLLGVRVYLTLGLLAGLARAVPVIGPMLSAVPIALIAGMQVDWQAAAVALAVFAVMHFVESKLIMPKVIGLEAQLHPVVVIVALLAGGEFFGVLGMFVAVPVASMARVVFLHWQAHQEQLRAAAEAA